MTTKSQHYKEDDEISMQELILKIRDFKRYLFSKWLTIIVFTLIGGLLGFLYAYRQKPVYTATTTFVLESGDGGGGLGQYAGIASVVGIDLGSSGGGLFQGENILDLYRSRRMIEKTLFSPLDSISTHSLMEKYIQINRLKEASANSAALQQLYADVDIWNNKARILDSKNQRLRDSIIGKAVENINKSYLNVFKPDKKLSKIQVDVKSTDELFSKRFNEELVKNVNDFYIQTKTKKSLDNIAILQQKRDSVRSEMNGAIYQAAQVADATPNLNPTRLTQRVAPVQKAQATAETNKAILSSLIQNLEVSKIALMREAPLIQLVDSPVFPLDQQKLGKIKALIIGGLIAAFLTTGFLIFRKWYISIVTSSN